MGSHISCSHHLQAVNLVLKKIQVRLSWRTVTSIGWRTATYNCWVRQVENMPKRHTFWLLTKRRFSGRLRWPQHRVQSCLKPLWCMWQLSCRHLGACNNCWKKSCFGKNGLADFQQNGVPTPKLKPSANAIPNVEVPDGAISLFFCALADSESISEISTPKVACHKVSKTFKAVFEASGNCFSQFWGHFSGAY